MLSLVFSKSIPQNEPVKVIPLIAGKTLPACLDNEEKKRIKTAMEQSDFTAKPNTFLTVLGGKSKIILAGISEHPTPLEWEKTGGGLASYLSKDVSAAFIMPKGKNIAPEAAAYVAYGLQLGAYRFDKYITQKKEDKSFRFKKMTCVMDTSAGAAERYKHLSALAESVYHARNLCNEPGNTLTPKIFAADILKLAELGIEVEVLEPKTLKEKGFNLLMAVAQGSANEPRVVILKWCGKSAKKEFDMGLVGKGVTFDSGGLNLKPYAAMLDMHHDMNGAAAVVSTLESLAKQKSKINVVGIVGLVENMPSGTAIRPQDIIKSLSGQTVEILNTDAEGRLVLADCMWYLQETYGVKKMIDIATLTAAVMAALGSEYAGLFCNDEKLAADLKTAGEISGEKVWQLPMGESYNKKLDSMVADMKNIGGPLAGGSTAACFLARFVKDGVAWAHLDIAGVDKEDTGTPLCPKGATGFGTQLLNALLHR